ncbi:hypothetical protein R8Z50_07465 [Longispora sp. K20-0274]|uniref:hypothetical protein n=1 Tax=Longispora sp. K20-0274 TaxID=3088255 RepID=UPI00399A9AAD
MFTRLARLAPLAGVVYLILVLAGFIVGGTDGVGSDQPTDKVVAWWQDNKSQQTVACLLVAYGSLALVWFAGSLRRALSRAEGGDGRLGAVALAGSVILTLGLLSTVGFALVAADTVGKVPGEVTQTFSVASNEFFLPIAAGAFLLYAAAGLGILYTRVLPQWLGWLTLVLAVVALTPFAWFAFLATGLWAAGVGIVLFMRGEAPA